MEVILIKHTLRYDDYEETVGIAKDMDLANKYIEDLKTKWPYVYGDNCGRFSFEKYDVIDD